MRIKFQKELISKEDRKINFFLININFLWTSPDEVLTFLNYEIVLIFEERNYRFSLLVAVKYGSVSSDTSIVLTSLNVFGSLRIFDIFDEFWNYPKIKSAVENQNCKDLIFKHFDYLRFPARRWCESFPLAFLTIFNFTEKRS